MQALITKGRVGKIVIAFVLQGVILTQRYEKILTAVISPAWWGKLQMCRQTGGGMAEKTAIISNYHPYKMQKDAAAISSVNYTLVISGFNC